MQFPEFWTTALVIFNLVMMEILLSVDNAAVLATMVKGLPEKEQAKALRYGLFGAYIFRGLTLLFASYLIEVHFLKALGGAYLIFLGLNHFYQKRKKKAIVNNVENADRKQAGFSKFFGSFWGTIVMVEFVDLTFSLDNVFAAVAFTDNIYLICTGVFIGILAIRFVAQGFIKLIQKYPLLEEMAFAVIAFLGFKLSFSYIAEFFPNQAWSIWLNGHDADLYLSFVTIILFALPIVLNPFLKKKEKEKTVSEGQNSTSKFAEVSNNKKASNTVAMES